MPIAKLAEAIASARKAWPGVELSDERFTRYLEERLPDGTDASEGLALLHVDDLFLACACVEGDERAVAALDRAYLAQVPAFVSRLRLPPELVDEVRQELCVRLLVAEEDARPMIARYAGTGPLASWLRVVAVRTALGSRRRAKEHESMSEAEAVAVALNPEADAIKGEYKAAFEDALREAFVELPARARTLLRLHHVDRLDGDAVAAMYGVHRVTAARWLGDARASIHESVAQKLTVRLGISREELDAVIRFVRSRLELSLRALLADPGL